MVVQIKESSELQELLQAHKYVFVDFFAVWCGPCRMIAPVVEEFEKTVIERTSEEKPGIKFAKVDVDELSELAVSYNISAMPTFVLFKDGEELKTIIGANQPAIKEAVEEILEAPEEDDNDNDDAKKEDGETEEQKEEKAEL